VATKKQRNAEVLEGINDAMETGDGEDWVAKTLSPEAWTNDPVIVCMNRTEQNKDLSAVCKRN